MEANTKYRQKRRVQKYTRSSEQVNNEMRCLQCGGKANTQHRLTPSSIPIMAPDFGSLVCWTEPGRQTATENHRQPQTGEQGQGVGRGELGEWGGGGETRRR